MPILMTEKRTEGEITMRKVFVSYDDRKKEERRNNLYESFDAALKEIKDKQYICCEIAEVYDIYYNNQMYGYIIVDHTNCPYDVTE